MTTLEQIKQKQDELNKMIEDFIVKDFIEDTPSEYGWKPEEMCSYWFVTDYGEVEGELWNGRETDTYRLSIGNCFETREQAEKYKLRLKSMKPKYLPEMLNKFWYVESNINEFDIDLDSWENDIVDQELYFLGRTFRTREEAQDWITNYAKAWEI